MARRAASGYRLSPKAEDDLSDIWLYTAQNWSMGQAENYLRGLEEKLRQLCQNPRLAPERSEISPPVRLYIYRSHLVIYRIEGEFLAIIRVLHNRQHWQALIES
ncbi:MAG: type II toxin-antitoxin system RelE/ParE family toxin [Mangrovicoccus sp.]